MSDKVQITIKNKVGEKYADLQTKIVTPSKEIQVITADEGYYGLREVIVGAPVIDGESLLEAINGVNTKVDETEISINQNTNNILISLTESDITSDDIRYGKEAFVNGTRISGTLNLALEMIKNATNHQYLFYNRSSVAKQLEELTDIDVLEIGNTDEDRDCDNLFYNCNTITKFPFKLYLKTGRYFSASINYSHYGYIFHNCTNLEEIDLMLSSYSGSGNHNISFDYIFYGCENLKNIKLDFDDNSNILRTSSIASAFYNCTNLETIDCLFYFNNLNGNYDNLFYGCKNLKNIKFYSVYLYNLRIGYGDGTSTNDYGTLLTIESLLSLFQAISYSSSRTCSITIGTANMNKLTDIYVRLIDSSLPNYNGFIQDENKYKPFEVCNADDEGAMTIKEYTTLKRINLY